MSSTQIPNFEPHCFYKDQDRNEFIPKWFVEASRQEADVLLTSGGAGNVLMRGTRLGRRGDPWKYVISSKTSSNSETVHYLVMKMENGFRLDIDETYKPQEVSCLSHVMDFFLETIGSIKGTKVRLYSGQSRSGTIPKVTHPHYMPMNKSGSQSSQSENNIAEYLVPVDESNCKVKRSLFAAKSSGYADRSRSQNGSDNMSISSSSEEYICPSICGSDSSDLDKPVFSPCPVQGTKTNAAGSPEYKNTPKVQQTNGGGTSMNHNGTATLSPNQFHDYINISNAQVADLLSKEVSPAATNGTSGPRSHKSPDLPPSTCRGAKVPRGDSSEYVEITEGLKNCIPTSGVNSAMLQKAADFCTTASPPDYAVIDEDYFENKYPQGVPSQATDKRPKLPLSEVSNQRSASPVTPPRPKAVSRPVVPPTTMPKSANQFNFWKKK